MTRRLGELVVLALVLTGGCAGDGSAAREPLLVISGPEAFEGFELRDHRERVVWRLVADELLDITGAPALARDRARAMSSAAASDALADGEPVLPVVRYFEAWILRLHGLEHELLACAGCHRELGSEIRVSRVTLPEEAARTAVSAAALWGMPYTAVDFMRDETSGRYLLLECNSSPFFVNFERRSGCDISGRIADYLVGRRRRGDTGAPAETRA